MQMNPRHLPPFPPCLLHTTDARAISSSGRPSVNHKIRDTKNRLVNRSCCTCLDPHQSRLTGVVGPKYVEINGDLPIPPLAQFVLPKDQRHPAQTRCMGSLFTITIGMGERPYGDAALELGLENVESTQDEV